MSTKNQDTFKGSLVPAEGRPGHSICTELWFPDGSIILQAESILFRVYSGLLAQYSPFFRDLFSIPQPESDQDIYQGIPVVQMSETANELRYFLLADLDNRYVALWCRWRNLIRTNGVIIHPDLVQSPSTRTSKSSSRYSNSVPNSTLLTSGTL